MEVEEGSSLPIFPSPPRTALPSDARSRSTSPTSIEGSPSKAVTSALNFLITNLNALQPQLEKQESQLGLQRNRITTLEEVVSEKNTELGTLQATLVGKAEEISTLTSTVQSQRNEISEVNAQLSQQRTLTSNQLKEIKALTSTINSVQEESSRSIAELSKQHLDYKEKTEGEILTERSSHQSEISGLKGNIQTLESNLAKEREDLVATKESAKQEMEKEKRRFGVLSFARDQLQLGLTQTTTKLKEQEAHNQNITAQLHLTTSERDGLQTTIALLEQAHKAFVHDSKANHATLLQEKKAVQTARDMLQSRLHSTQESLENTQQQLADTAQTVTVVTEALDQSRADCEQKDVELLQRQGETASLLGTLFTHGGRVRDLQLARTTLHRRILLLEERSAELSTELTTTKDWSQAQITQLGSLLDASRSSESELQSANKQLVARIVEIQTFLAEMKKELAAAQELELAHSTAAAQAAASLADLRRAYEELLEQSATQQQSLEQQIAELTAQYNLSCQKVADLEQKLEHAVTLQSTLEASIGDGLSREAAADAHLEQLEADWALERDEAKTEQRSLRVVLTALNDKLQKSRQEALERSSKIAELDILAHQTHEQVEASRLVTEARIAELVSEKGLLQTTIDQTTMEHSEQLKKIRAEIDENVASLSAMTADRDEFKAKLSASEDKVKSLETEIEEELRVQLRETQDELLTLRSESEAARIQATQLGQIRASHDDLLKRSQAQAAKITELERRMSKTKDLEARAIAAERQLLEAIEENAELRAGWEKVEEVDQALRQTKALLDQTMSNLEESVLDNADLRKRRFHLVDEDEEEELERERKRRKKKWAETLAWC